MSNTITGEWNIRSRGSTCALTGQPFVDKQTVYSSLYHRKGEYERRDYAVETWKEQEGNDGLLSSWKSIYKQQHQSGAETLKKDDAEGLLRRLLELNSPDHAAARYILALMLERKRLIRELERKTIDGTQVLVYEHINSGDVWVIQDPQIQLSAMEAVQEQVAKLMAEGV